MPRVQPSLRRAEPAEDPLGPQLQPAGPQPPLEPAGQGDQVDATTDASHQHLPEPAAVHLRALGFPPSLFPEGLAHGGGISSRSAGQRRGHDSHWQLAQQLAQQHAERQQRRQQVRQQRRLQQPLADLVDPDLAELVDPVDLAAVAQPHVLLLVLLVDPRLAGQAEPRPAPLGLQALQHQARLLHEHRTAGPGEAGSHAVVSVAAAAGGARAGLDGQQHAARRASRPDGDARQQPREIQAGPRLHLLRQGLLEEVRIEDPYQVCVIIYLFIYLLDYSLCFTRAFGPLH